MLLSDAKIDPNIKCIIDGCETTALYCAVNNMNHKIVALLLSCPTIDPNIKCFIDKCETTPLYCAVEKMDHKIISLLLSCPKIDPNIRVLKKTPLHLAIEENDIEIVKLLLSCKKTDVNKKSTYQCNDRWNNLKRSSTISSMVMNTVLLPFSDGGREKTKTPLHVAVITNNFVVAELLLKDKRTDINIIDEEGKKPINYVEKEEMKRLFKSSKK